jgi:hypothetical protein
LFKISGSPDGSEASGLRGGYRLGDREDGAFTRCQLVAQRQTYAISVSWIALSLQAWQKRFVLNQSNAGLLRDDKCTPNKSSFVLRYSCKLGYWIDCRQRLLDDSQFSYDC